MNDWDVSPSEAAEVQRQLRDRLVVAPPAAWPPRTVAGADISSARGDRTGHAGIVVLDWATRATVEEASAAVELRFPYVPGLLSFRELPAVAAAWARLDRRPELLVFDGAGYAHPRRFGLACHGGVLLDVPSIGCAKTILVGQHGPLGEARGATAELVHRGEVVGMAVRTRDGVRPLYVSVGHRIDLPHAVETVLHLAADFREPETTRRAHRLVNALRRAAAPG